MTTGPGEFKDSLMLLACMREGAETGMPADAGALKKYGMDSKETDKLFCLGTQHHLLWQPRVERIQTSPSYAGATHMACPST